VDLGGAACTDRQPPVVQLLKPLPNANYPAIDPYPVHFEALADDTATGNSGIAKVQYLIDWSGAKPLALPTSGQAPWPVDWSETAVDAYLGLLCSKAVDLRAYAEDGCGNSALSPPVPVSLVNTAVFCDASAAASGPAPTASAVSELALPGGSGQVVANGTAAFPHAGRTTLALAPARGENRIEATLVEGRTAGTWRFDLGAVPGFNAGSLRVVAGDVAEVGASAIVFRLRGRPGERVVFSFRVTP
jgi:hypothetical protein